MEQTAFVGFAGFLAKSIDGVGHFGQNLKPNEKKLWTVIIMAPIASTRQVKAKGKVGIFLRFVTRIF